MAARLKFLFTVRYFASLTVFWPYFARVTAADRFIKVSVREPC